MEHIIDLKVNVDAREAEELKRLPEDVRLKWEQLNRTLAQGPPMQGPRGQQLQQATGQMQEAAQRAAAGQGFFTSSQRREFEKNL